MTLERQNRITRLGSAKALTRGGADPGLEFNLRPLSPETLTIRVASSPLSPERSGGLRSPS